MMARKRSSASTLCLLLCFFVISFSDAQMPGFLSIDCGGSGNYTDDLGLVWTADAGFPFGATAAVSTSPPPSRHYSTLRYFPGDGSKYCYTVAVKTRTRYLVRATFLYGNFDGGGGGGSAFPEFDLYVGASHWCTIVIYDEATVVSKEMVVLALAPTLSVCLAGQRPFISTLELRQLNGSLYYTPYEEAADMAFLSLAARINFGAPTADPVRYPDDPFDRIWESDMARRPNYLVDVAPGTARVATVKPVLVDSDERPPEKVMQTAVVGRLGELTYRLDLSGFPGPGWAFSYFAEVEDDDDDGTWSRKFKLFIPGLPEVSKATVDIAENAPGKYRLYQPGFFNITLPFVLSFAFRDTNDSARGRGPILNALEIYRYVRINPGSPDAPVMASLASRWSSESPSERSWAREGGDPCLPSPWSWLKCTPASAPQPRVTSINLSGKNLTGNIPPELASLPCLAEIRLDNNMLSGPIPDLSASSNLSIIHLENNQLTGSVPSYLSSLPRLTELYLEDNKLSGAIPRTLLTKSIIFQYSGNMELRKGNEEKHGVIMIVCAVLGVSLLPAAVLCWYMIKRRRDYMKKYTAQDDATRDNKVAVAHKKEKEKETMSEGGGEANMMTESAHAYRLSELEEATDKFAKRIGSGGFGIVYYGKLRLAGDGEGREIAVKVPSNAESQQGRKQFANEVALLSRIHHRNLVAFLGYCLHQQEEEAKMKMLLVYEFMHNGTLKEHLHGPHHHLLGWMKRLEIAEDAAKGMEYLHTGCTPSIIHRDIKTSNILLDRQMRAKVADLGLSRIGSSSSQDSTTTTHVRGTLGYLDPHYYTSQQLTEKSDVYSFGIILLELISGRPPISAVAFGHRFRNIAPWVKVHYESGDIEAIMDPRLKLKYHDVHSVWKMAETAVRCIDADPANRPSMPEVVKEIQEAIALERPPPTLMVSSFSPTPASHPSPMMRSHDMIMDKLMHDVDSSFSASLNYPDLR